MYDTNGRVFLVRHNGPEFNDWGIPKGRLNDGEDTLLGAMREFQEETGLEVDMENITFSGVCQLTTRKLHYWGYRGHGDEEFQGSNSFNLEWPKGSGNMRTIPEIETGRWFTMQEAMNTIHDRQIPVLIDFSERFLKFKNNI